MRCFEEDCEYKMRKSLDILRKIVYNPRNTAAPK